MMILMASATVSWGADAPTRDVPRPAVTVDGVAPATRSATGVLDAGMSPAMVEGRWCGPSNTPKDFRALETYLNVYFGARNANQVWQADSNAEIWRVYCFASGGRAKISYSGSRLIDLTPPFIRLSDGTRVDIRIASASGGWTVDINRPGVAKLYKVHVRRVYAVALGE